MSGPNSLLSTDSQSYTSVGSFEICVAYSAELSMERFIGGNVTDKYLSLFILNSEFRYCISREN